MSKIFRPSRVAFKGKLLSLVTQRRRLPNGHVATVEIVEHPGAVVIVPFLKKDTVVLIRQYRPAIKAYLYEFPAGTINKGEKPSSCAGRELIEETGFRAQKLTRLGEIYPVPGYSTEIITIYKAQGLRPATAPRDADEIITTGVFGKAKIKSFFKSGRIKDAKTICALALCGWV